MFSQFMTLLSEFFVIVNRSIALLTLGPGGPTLPADPGKPVAPYKIHKNKN